MASNLLFPMAGILFAVQLVLCFAKKPGWVRVLPLALTAVAEAVCWGLYLGGCFSEIYGAAFAFYIYGVVLAVVLGGEVLAWGIYGIVKVIQKRRK